MAVSLAEFDLPMAACHCHQLSAAVKALAARLVANEAATERLTHRADALLPRDEFEQFVQQVNTTCCGCCCCVCRACV